MWVDPLDPVRQKMVELIPPQGSVVTNFEFLSHLSHGRDVYAFYNVWKDANYFSGQTPFILPKTVKYALINFKDPWLVADLKYNHAATMAHMKKFFNANAWHRKASAGSIVLYERINRP